MKKINLNLKRKEKGTIRKFRLNERPRGPLSRERETRRKEVCRVCRETGRGYSRSDIQIVPTHDSRIKKKTS